MIKNVESIEESKLIKSKMTNDQSQNPVNVHDELFTEINLQISIIRREQTKTILDGKPTCKEYLHRIIQIYNSKCQKLPANVINEKSIR